MATSLRQIPSSFNAEHLPKDPFAIDEIRTSLGSFLMVKSERFENSTDEKVKTICKKVLATLLPFYQKIEKKKDETFPAPWAQFFKWKALCELASGDTEQAEVSWMRYVRIIPKNELDRNATCNFFYYIGHMASKYELAIERYSKGIEIVGSNELLLKNRLAIFLIQENWEKAVHDLRAMEKIGTQDLCFSSLLGVYYKSIGEFSLAEKYLSQAIGLAQGKDSEIEKGCSDLLQQIQIVKKIILSMGIGTPTATSTRTLELEKTLNSLPLTRQKNLYCDVFHLALAYKCAGQFFQANAWIKRAQILATTGGQRNECAFLAHAIREKISTPYFRLTRAVTHLHPTSHFKSSFVHLVSATTFSSLVKS